MAKEKANTNPRAKKLFAIRRQIASFVLGETYTDESEAQEKLANASQLIKEASDLLVKSDE